MNCVGKALVVCGVMVGVVYASGNGKWGYGETRNGVYGPKDWGKVSTYCSGHSQSPVNIISKEAAKDVKGKPLDVSFDNKHGKVTGTFSNNGHSPTLALDKDKGSASVLNPVGDEKFILEQFHIHFGCDDNVGSEHTVDNKEFSAEDTNDASEELDDLANKLTEIKEEGSKVADVSVNLGSLVPDLSSGRRSYYTYKGSLTTPGCYESVCWVVLKDPISIDDAVLEKFRALKATHGFHHGKMCNNYRPTLPLYGRKVISVD